MGAILILLIISIQFLICYFSVKRLSDLNNNLIKLNQKVEDVSKQIPLKFDTVRQSLQYINQTLFNLYENKQKILLYRKLVLLKSTIVAIILFKKRKNILNFFSLYDIVSKFIKKIMEF